MKNNLKKIREAKGLSQNDLFRKTGISQQYFSLLEQGKTELTVEKAIVISKALQCRISELYNEIDPSLDKLPSQFSNLGQILQTVRELAGVPIAKMAMLLEIKESEYKRIEKISEDTPENKDTALRLMAVALSAYSAGRLLRDKPQPQNPDKEHKLLQLYNSLDNVEQSRLLNIAAAMTIPPAPLQK